MNDNLSITPCFHKHDSFEVAYLLLDVLGHFFSLNFAQPSFFSVQTANKWRKLKTRSLGLSWCNVWVLSIMPKILEISVGIQMERSVSVSSERNIRITSWGGPDIPVGIFRPKCAVPFTDFLVPSTALLSLARSIMADTESVQSPSCYQCSVCSYTTTDFSQLLMHSCSAMTGCFVVFKSYMHFPAYLFFMF